ncbi:MAG TPA: hypothetical protein VNL14_18035 [Candidatus Acidoferrales bacterium]|nr:hypothetical protein [Candidatus Acidoferrales bacterium]
MDTWQESRPSDTVTQSILLQIRGDLRREAKPATAGLGWSISGLGVALISALIASLLSIGSSIVLDYGSAAEFFKFALQQLDISLYPRDSAIFFIVGCLYGLLPLAFVGLLFGRLAGAQGVRRGLWVVAIFLLITLPYVVVECRTFAFNLALSLITGLTLGAVSGGVAGCYLANRRPATC